ncbi:MAG: inorganic phosphate transporter, partial [Bacteroidales bacterium]
SREKIDLTFSFVEYHYPIIINAFCNEDLKTLRTETGEINVLKERTKKIKKMGTIGIRRLSSNDALEKGLYFYQANDFISELIYCLGRINTPCQEHIDNNFNPLNDIQKEELRGIMNTVVNIIKESNRIVQQDVYEERKELYSNNKNYLSELTRIKRGQLKRIKEQQASTKVSMIYLSIIQESENIVSYTNNIVKVSRKLQRDH